MVMMAVGSILVLVMCKEFDGLFVFVIMLDFDANQSCFWLLLSCIHFKLIVDHHDLAV